MNCLFDASGYSDQWIVTTKYAENTNKNHQQEIKIEKKEDYAQAQKREKKETELRTCWRACNPDDLLKVICGPILNGGK